MISNIQFNNAEDICTYFNMPVYNIQKQVSGNTNTLKNDTANLSNKKAKKRFSKKVKLAMALGAFIGNFLILNAVSKYRKPINFEKAQQYFSDIFERDFLKEEARQIIGKYKETLKIKEPEEFCKKVFEEAKNNFGYKNADIDLILIKPTTLSEAYKNPEGGITANNVAIKLPLRTRKPNVKLSLSNKKEIFDSIHHELKHIKQNEIAYRSEPQRCVESLAKRYSNAEIDKIIEKTLKIDKLEGTEEEKEQCRKIMFDSIIKNLNNVLDNLYRHPIRFEKNSAEYQKGLKYIEALNSYSMPKIRIIGQTKYRANMLEKEAFDVSDKAGQIYDFIMRSA